MAPMEAVDNAVAGGEGLACSPANCTTGLGLSDRAAATPRRPPPWEHQPSTPLWVSLRPSRRANSRGPHVGDGGLHWVALFGEEIPEQGGAGGKVGA